MSAEFAIQARHAPHLISAFATTCRLILGQEVVPDKASAFTAAPPPLARLGENDKGHGRSESAPRA